MIKMHAQEWRGLSQRPNPPSSLEQCQTARTAKPAKSDLQCWPSHEGSASGNFRLGGQNGRMLSRLRFSGVGSDANYLSGPARTPYGRPTEMT